MQPPFFEPCVDPSNRVKHIVYTGVHRGCLQTFFLFFIFILKIFSKKLFSPQPDLQNFRRNNCKHFFFSEKKVGFLLFFSRYYTLFFSVFLPDFPKSSIFCQKRILVDPTKKVSFSAFSGWLSEKGGCKMLFFTRCTQSPFWSYIWCFSLLLLRLLFFIGMLFLYFGPFIDPDRQTFLDPGWTSGFDHGPKSKNFDPGVQKSTSLSVRDFERKKRVF